MYGFGFDMKNPLRVGLSAQPRFAAAFFVKFCAKIMLAAAKNRLKPGNYLVNRTCPQ
jgi:hypothetical protein